MLICRLACSKGQKAFEECSELFGGRQAEPFLTTASEFGDDAQEEAASLGFLQCEWFNMMFDGNFRDSKPQWRAAF